MKASSHPLLASYDRMQAFKQAVIVNRDRYNDYVENRSWWDWLVNLFSPHESAVAHRVAQDAYSAALLAIHRSTKDWVAGRVSELLRQDAPATAALAKLTERGTELASRIQTLDKLQQEAGQVTRRLDSAISECQSASTGEMFDMLSKSKSMALLSHMQTETAKDSLKAADTALREFTARWPKRSAALELPAIDNTMDLFIDLCGGPDLFSFFNMSALDDAAAACAKAKSQLESAIQNVALVRQSLKNQQGELLSHVHAVKTPFLAQAHGELPEPLREFAPSLLAI